MDDCLIYVDIEVEGPICIAVENVCSEVINTESSSQYFFEFVNSNTYTSSLTEVPEDLTLYTMESVNNSFDIFADGVKYYYYENAQNFSDQVIIEGNVFRFLYEVTRLEVRFTNRLILK
jgi:hypothetical protein